MRSPSYLPALLVCLLLVLLGGCSGGTVGGPGSDGDGAIDSGGDRGDQAPDAATDSGTDAFDGGPDAAGDSGSGDTGPGDGDGAIDGGDQGPPYGAEFFVSLSGDDNNPGTIDLPFASLERARNAIRSLKAQSGLPVGGVVVWLRAGLYQRSATFDLAGGDSGEDGKPVVYRAYRGEVARLVGGRVLVPSWFSLVADTSPVWDRIDAVARGNVQQIDLGSHQLTDYGTLLPRGFYDPNPAALELFFNQAPMQLARWPDATDDDPPATPSDDTISIYGDPIPDVTGVYAKSGTQDGVNAYQRQGLIGGKQYNFYRYTWVYQGQTYTAWFLTTNPSGYPPDTDPWWYLYSPDFGSLSPGTGASGTPTTVDPASIHHGFASIAGTASDTSFTYNGTRPKRWSQAEEVWFHGYWKYMWADLHVLSSGIDTTTKTITLTQVPGYGIQTGQPYYAENLLEEITTPGEWYLNRTSGILYFWPPADLASSEMIASMLGTPLVHLNGASWVTLQDLVIEIGRNTLVQIEGGAHNRLQHCVLRNAGTAAVEASGADNGLDHCQLYDSGDGAVILSGGDRKSLTAAGNFLRNCELHHFGRWSWTYKPAALLSGVGQIVEHNLMHDAPHTAVLYSGNEHHIEYNDIHHVCQFSSDAGAVYSGRDWGYRGNRVRFNFIHDIASFFTGYGVHGVYLDDCLSGVEVFGNVLYRISDLGVLAGGGRDNRIENNVIARCGHALLGDSRGLQAINHTPGSDWNLLERLTYDGIQYQADPWATAYPSLAAIPNDWSIVGDPANLWLYPQGCVFSRNIGFANGGWTVEENYGGSGTFDKYAEILDNIQDQDPLFEDEPNLDLTLKPGSPAFTIPGFQAIPFRDIGIQP